MRRVGVSEGSHNVAVLALVYTCPELAEQRFQAIRLSVLGGYRSDEERASPSTRSRALANIITDKPPNVFIFPDTWVIFAIQIDPRCRLERVQDKDRE